MVNHRKATDGGSISFSRRQLFIAAPLYVIASAFIFLLGILIGQSIEERKILRREEPAVKVPVKTDAPRADQEMTFYETLGKPEPAPPRAEEPPARTPWSVQVAASRNRATADEMAASLTKQGYRAYVTSGRLNETTFYRVRVGRFGTRQEAMAELQRLKAAKYKNAMITRNR
ncbi:MAG: SPOR domain-containing protein [Deltaproteobacteria bacterium]|nr:SPOR domain-containing protein [Deltaproteobacteria bacterium]MDE0212636.1 SPOR domain-containing protein [Deltaproteobacteria bacterium]